MAPGPAVEVRALPLRLAAPFRLASETVRRVDNAVAVARAGGEAGFGEAAPVASVTHEDLATAAAAFRAWRAAGHAGGGLRHVDRLRSPAMRCAVEGALLDLAARHAGEPLCTFLGGAPPRSVESSAVLDLRPAPRIAGWVRRQRLAGFRVLKAKAGLGLAEDLRRLALVREAAGPGAALRVDANMGWTREEARRALPRLAELGVQILEQPLAAGDLAGHAALLPLARDAGVGLMLDESVHTADDVRRAAARGACDWVNVKLQKCGGMRAALAMLDAAQQAGLRAMVGCMVESRLGVLQAAHAAAAHPAAEAADLCGHVVLRRDPVHGGGDLVGGRFVLGASPGLGVAAVDAGAALDGPAALAKPAVHPAA